MIITKNLKMHSIVADVLVGRLIAGNELYLTNERSTFAVSGSSATLSDGVFSLTRSDGNSKINIDPNVGVEILKRDAPTNTYDRQFYVDTQGNVCFSGSLVAASGYFTGKITANSGQIGAWSIDDFGLYDIYGNYIYGNGKVRLGKLTIDGSIATFDGNIYARNLQDYVYGSQIRNINADTITAGTITGINIYGSRIAWPGVLMHSPVSGISEITALNELSIVAGNNGIFLDSGGTAIRSESIVSIGNTQRSGQISLLGSIATSDANFNQGWGWTTDIPVSNGSSITTLHFVNGILIDPYHYSYSGSSVAEYISFMSNGITSIAYMYITNGGNSTTVDFGDATSASSTYEFVHQYSVTGSYEVKIMKPDEGWSGITSISITTNFYPYGNVPNVSDLINLATFSFESGFSNYSSGIFVTQANLSTLYLQSNGYNQLTQTAIDAILADLVISLSLSGRVICTVDLRYNSTPSATGLADKATLESAGWTVYTS